MPGRGERIFVFAITTVIMAVLASWLMWVRDTERWTYLWLYFIVLAFVIGRLWNYRPPG